MGVVGLSYKDFCRLRPLEFEAICKAYNQRAEMEDRAKWERMRLLATISIQPHVKNKISARNLIPFPWDNENAAAEAEPVSREEAYKRFKKLTEK